MTSRRRRENAQALWLHDMLLERVDGQPLEIAKCKQALESCLLVVMRGVAENDGYNALVLEAGLWWRDVALIRTLSRYLRQIRVAFSQDYMWTTLRKHSGIAAQLSQLFQTRFDPRLDVSAEERAAQEDAIAKRDRRSAHQSAEPRRRPHYPAFRQCRSARRSAPISIRSTRRASRRR